MLVFLSAQGRIKGEGLEGHDTPFLGTPKLHKEGENVVCIRANAMHFGS